jgi:hypothetical protein
MWYDFYPTRCVIFIPSPRLGDRNHTTHWIKIISHHKKWEILYLPTSKHVIWNSINLLDYDCVLHIVNFAVLYLLYHLQILHVYTACVSQCQKSGHIGDDELEIAAGRRGFIKLFSPVRIRVRIDPPRALVCRKRRLNGAVLRMRPEKQRSRVTAGMARLRSLPVQRPWAPSIGQNYAALHRQWWRLHRSEIFLSGT